MTYCSNLFFIVFAEHATGPAKSNKYFYLITYTTIDLTES